LNKRDYINAMAEYTGYGRVFCKEFVRAQEKFMADWLLSGGEICLWGVCTLGTTIRPSFEAYDFKTGDFTRYPEKLIPYCNFSDVLKDKIAKSANAPTKQD